MTASLISSYVKQGLKQAIGRKKNSNCIDREGSYNLNEKFCQDYAVCRGCKVNIVELEQVTRQCNLKIMNIKGINTQYT